MALHRVRAVTRAAGLVVAVRSRDDDVVDRRLERLSGIEVRGRVDGQVEQMIRYGRSSKAAPRSTTIHCVRLGVGRRTVKRLRVTGLRLGAREKRLRNV